MGYFYKERFPKVNDLVHVIISEITDLTVYCTLSEYNDIQGMILISELSNRKNQNTRKVVTLGKKEILLVLKVDPENGFIDLSKKRVSVADYTETIQKYSDRLIVNQILQNVYNKNKTESIEKLYELYCWNQLDPLKHLKSLVLIENTETILKNEIKNYFKEKKLKITYEVSIYCYEKDGVDIIKRVLLNNLKESKDVSIKLISAPDFEISCISNEIKKQEDSDKLTDFVHKIQNELGDLGGNLKIEKEINVC